MAVLPPSGDDPRWRVDVTNLERHEHTSDAWEALTRWNEHLDRRPAILLRGDTLTRVSHDEEHVKLASFNRPSLTELLSEGVIFIKRKESTDGTASWMRVAPPAYIADALLSRTPDRLPGAIRINRVVEVPVFGAMPPDDKPIEILGIPGYDEQSRTFYQPPPNFEMPALDVSDFGTGIKGGEEFWIQVELMREARDRIYDLLADFPFADEASRAHAICMLLEPFVREVIGGEPTPMYGVMAHTPGTGKGLLTQCCLGVSCGTLSIQTWSGGKGFEAAENRKQLTAKLIEAPPVIFYDNVTEPLDSGVLAGALTATRWNDRILGSTRMADVPIRNVWVFTANNPTISRELTRRIVPIYLDPGDVDPLTRTEWTHRLPQWATEHRADLVRAALTLSASYLAGTHTEYDYEGAIRSRPEVADVLASYPGWSRVLGGILETAEIPSFLGNLEKLHQEAAVDVRERGALLADWYERQAAAYSLRDLAGPGGILGATSGWPPAELPLELKGHGDKFEVKFGVWLRDHRDEVIDGYRVRKIDGRPAKWIVEKVGA
jgi:hypothetical protein